jgi:V/A-type H+-transporting ATPase subunit I
MRKLNLAGMSYDRDNILNALQRTGAVEIKEHTEVPSLSFLPFDSEELKGSIARYENAIAILSVAVDEYDKENKIKSDVTRDGFDITYTEFMSARDKRADAEKTVEKIYRINEQKSETINSLSKIERTIQTAEIYSTVVLPFSSFSATAHTFTKLGTIPLTDIDNFREKLSAIPLSDWQKINQDDEKALIEVIFHKSCEGDVVEALSASSFTPCPFEGDVSGEQVYKDALATREKLKEKLVSLSTEMVDMKKKVRPLKVYTDYLAFELEKLETGAKTLTTERTFLLEAYIPSGQEENIEQAICDVSNAVYYEFSDPLPEENPPTLMNNRPLFSNFEMITNTYSPPNSRELDPTIIMSFFYSIFLGFIMADIGYGLVMFLVGGCLYLKTAHKTGFKQICGVFAVGGVFSIIWGILFNSLFGISLGFMPTILPDAQRDMWSLAGISVPAVLIISMLLGCGQLFAGYVCLAVQCWRRGEILDGLFKGITWAVFSVGVALAIVGFVEEFNASALAGVGGILAGVGLVSAMLTAGRGEKILGKFTKGFGAAYGVINYVSDILSYARLYGLMLSGAVIAQIVSQYAVQFITGGNFAFAVLGIILMIVGHAFNLAMSLLGAYIHDARLQYVEFYGRFFEGEGELFTPLGSTHKYVYVKQ